MKKFRLLSRLFSEDPFKDAEGRFMNRWDSQQNPNLEILNQTQIPVYKVPPGIKVDKSRLFDFDLPQEFTSFIPPLSIWAISGTMFSVNQVWIPGPILIFPEAVFQWHASRIEDLEDHHLDIIRLVQPKIDYVVVGTGDSKAYNFAGTIREKFKMIGINIDFCPTVRNMIV